MVASASALAPVDAELAAFAGALAGTLDEGAAAALAAHAEAAREALAATLRAMEATTEARAAAADGNDGRGGVRGGGRGVRRAEWAPLVAALHGSAAASRVCAALDDAVRRRAIIAAAARHAAAEAAPLRTAPLPLRLSEALAGSGSRSGGGGRIAAVVLSAAPTPRSSPLLAARCVPRPQLLVERHRLDGGGGGGGVIRACDGDLASALGVSAGTCPAAVDVLLAGDARITAVLSSLGIVAPVAGGAAAAAAALAEEELLLSAAGNEARRLPWRSIVHAMQSELLAQREARLAPLRRAFTRAGLRASSALGWPAFAALFSRLLATDDAELLLALWRDAAWPQSSLEASVSFSDCAAPFLELRRVDLLA